MPVGRLFTLNTSHMAIFKHYLQTYSPYPLRFKTVLKPYKKIQKTRYGVDTGCLLRNRISVPPCNRSGYPGECLFFFLIEKILTFYTSVGLEILQLINIELLSSIMLNIFEADYEEI